MSWSVFPFFASGAWLCWTAGAWAAWRQRRSAALGLTLLGLAVYAVFLVGYWLEVGYPPLRTLGETRLWYVFFMTVSGLLTYGRWRLRWIPAFSALLSTVFLLVNVLKPQIHSQALMPALQSVWFIPHVSLYMFSYAFLGCAFLLAVRGLVRKDAGVFAAADHVTRLGFALFTIAMLLGALWAKAAWGDFWTWDLKETWAALTWLCYFFYFHLRQGAGAQEKTPHLWFLVAGFVAMQICWYGINFLPWAGESVHAYA